MNHSLPVRLSVKPACCRVCKGCGQDPATPSTEEPLPCWQCDGQGFLIYAESTPVLHPEKE